MKGLLRKDFYVLWKVGKYHLLCAAVFLCAGAFAGSDAFLSIYPGAILGVLPITLYSYDEHEQWCAYCRTLPVTPSQYVWGKYLFSLMLAGCSGLLLLAAQGVRWAVTGTLDWQWSGVQMISCLILSVFTPALLLPPLFRFGAERGRLFYVLFFGLVGVAMGMSFLFNENGVMAAFGGLLHNPAAPWILCAGFVGLWLLSLEISILCYRRREF